MESLPDPAAPLPGRLYGSSRYLYFSRKGEHTMKEYIQPEVELVKFTSESVTDIGTGVGSAETNTFTEDDIVIP